MITEIFAHEFMVKALIVGILISLCAALVGVSLVLRKNSMIGDGLSHVAFGAFAVATVFGFAPLEFSIPIVIIVSFFLLKLDQNGKMHGDAKIAILSSSSLAIGTFLVSVKGVNVDINNYLFGSILSISDKDLVISIILSIVMIIMYIFSYNKIFAITFDEKFAQSIGINVNLYNIIFGILCSIIVVLGMRLMGALLISSLIIFPTLSSMNLFKKFKSVIVSSVILSIVNFIIGLIVSYVYNCPTGATIVIVNLCMFIIFNLFVYIKNKRYFVKTN